MKPYIIALVVLCSLSLAAPVMAAELAVTQISSTEVRVDGTGFNPGTVTLLTETSIPVTPSGGDYSYEITGPTLPAGAVLALDASPVNDDLELYTKKNWLMVWTFDKSDGSTIGYSYDSSTGTVHVAREVPFKLRFQTMRVSGTTAHPNIDLNVTVQRNVTADGSGSFSGIEDITGIPFGDYMTSATDGANTATAQIAISTPGDLHRITITDPRTGNLTLDTNGSYTFGATGYDHSGIVVQGVTFTWTSSNTSVGTINSTTGYFEADNAGTTEVYARSGTKESNPVTVHVNDDDQITPADAAIALQIAVGSRPHDARLDVSGDGSVTSLDALMILQMAAKSSGIAPTTIVINELMPNPIGCDRGNETTELYNCGDEPVDIGGWILKNEDGATYAIPGGTTIAAYGYYLTAKIQLDNGGGQVFLYHDGDEVDGSIAYTDSTEGKSWQRRIDGLDTDSDSDWIERDHTFGVPG